MTAPGVSTEALYPGKNPLERTLPVAVPSYNSSPTNFLFAELDAHNSHFQPLLHFHF